MKHSLLIFFSMISLSSVIASQTLNTKPVNADQDKEVLLMPQLSQAILS